MSNTNTPPPLYALTPITETDNLEDNKPVYGMYQFANMRHLMDSKATHYLRPLPEGTRVLKPGEVAVRSGYTQIKNEDFYFLDEVVRWARGVGRNEAPEFIQQFIQTKLAQMGE